jgi:hypothetical protein
MAEPTGLIPSLNSSSNGVQDNGEVENFRMFPLMCDFFTQNSAVLIVKLGDPIDVRRALCNQGTFDKIR